jgi:hypothetical protein
MWSWNMNTARIVSSITEWQEDPTTYLAQLGSLAEVAGTQQIVLVVALGNDAGQRHKLPTAAAVEYWRSVSAKLKDEPNVIFGLLDDPRLDDAGSRFSQADWEFWRNEGTLDGEQYRGMQALVDVIRAAGGTQPTIAEGLGGVFTNIGGNLVDDSGLI